MSLMVHSGGSRRPAKFLGQTNFASAETQVKGIQGDWKEKNLRSQWQSPGRGVGASVGAGLLNMAWAWHSVSCSHLHQVFVPDTSSSSLESTSTHHTWRRVQLFSDLITGPSTDEGLWEGEQCIICGPLETVGG